MDDVPLRATTLVSFSGPLNRDQCAFNEVENCLSHSDLEEGKLEGFVAPQDCVCVVSGDLRRSNVGIERVDGMWTV